MADYIALDFLLKSVLGNADFDVNDHVYWEGVSTLFPKFSANQCKMRYNELLQSSPWFQEGSSHHSVGREKTSSSGDGKLRRPASSDHTKLESHPSTLSTHVKQSFKDSPIMVIHVCDEAKGVKQDFSCPRDLLVSEMKYFAEYLSSEQQRSEEVDISVHCDVQIFDWLMSYAKRDFEKVRMPQLDPNNAVSILISSDFLKMDSLVEMCIEYCHKNMAAILSTPCNMNCINDKLLSRIADKFTDSEADLVKDKKDKFMNKIFIKKIERLFDPEMSDNAITLYRCAACRRLLTRAMEKRVQCVKSRMTVDSRGNLVFRHLRDPSWDLNDHVLELRSQLSSWRDVFWRLWGSANFLTCARCGEAFPCVEIGHCRYHPEAARFDSANEETLGNSADSDCSSESSVSLVGVYPCCGTKTLRFDPLRLTKGCKVRDHLVTTTASAVLPGAKPPTETLSKTKTCESLLAHKQIIGVPYEPIEDDESEEIDLFSSEQLLVDRGQKTSILSDDMDGRSGPKLEPLTFEADAEEDEDSDGDSDDEVGDEETLNIRHARRKPKNVVTVQAEAILVDAPAFGTKKTKKWDTSKSLRTNQDAQRQEDRRRMTQIIDYLTKLRLNIDKNDKMKPKELAAMARRKEYAGGIFSRLEAQWKNQNCPPVARVPPLQNVRPKTKQNIGQPFR